jgi:D-alanyl-D-alanine dipeptidase
MVTFRCKRSGCLVTFTSEYDIVQMRQHPEYEEVKEPEKQKAKG